LVSFDAEIKSRQRLFNESAAILGVDKLDINSYHRYYKAGKLSVPLPHLVIIIDEFAQLKTQQPDFLAQLINVAQVGRSLGIHLILATQKPSGVVDPQIWSNSRFKVCLKVADKQDSTDMIGKPDSALIKNPGRCFIQIGYDEIYECVQSGYSGADYVPTKTYMADDEITVQLIDNTATPIHSEKLDLFANKTDKTQLEAIVADIVSLAVDKNLFVKPLWKDMLAEKILLDDLVKSPKSLLRADIGLADYVKTQEQKPLSIEFEKSGHIAVYGASGTGKTTLLQTLVFSLVCGYGYTPEELNIYALDFGGRNLSYLNGLPHTGGVVFEGDDSKISGLVELLQNTINERKRIFASNNCGTFSEYCIAGKKRLPAVLVLIDNYAPLHEKYTASSDKMLEIISAGKTYGVYFVVTGSTKNSIYYRVTDHISTYLTLKMNDEGSYFDIHNLRPPIVPEDVKGRGITVLNKEVIEFQVALALDKETETERMVEINSKYADIANQWTGVLPTIITETEFSAAAEYTDYSTTPQITPVVPSADSMLPDGINPGEDTLLVGTSMSGALSYGMDFAQDFKLVVCADNSDDLLNYYGKLIKNIMVTPSNQVAVIDDDEGRFSEIALNNDCKYIKGCDELSAFFEEIKPELNTRLDNNGSDESRLFFVIPDYNKFFSMVTDEQADFMRKITRHINSPVYRVYYVCGFDVSKEKSGDSLFFDLVAEAENYVLCPRSYSKASIKVPGLPYIHDVRASDSYFCQRERYVKIRW
jgi:S-DNA-T family DNA segregation ATPase FtsK/SpoIIIE